MGSCEAEHSDRPPFPHGAKISAKLRPKQEALWDGFLENQDIH